MIESILVAVGLAVCWLLRMLFVIDLVFEERMQLMRFIREHEKRADLDNLFKLVSFDAHFRARLYFRDPHKLYAPELRTGF